MFRKKKKEEIKITLSKFQIEKIKKQEGNVILAKVGDDKHYVTKQQLDDVASMIKYKFPNNTILVVPFYINIELLKIDIEKKVNDKYKLPPDEKRCMYLNKNGKRCKAWKCYGQNGCDMHNSYPTKLYNE